MYDLALNYRNKDITMLLGNKVGYFVKVDEGDMRWGRFLRFWVLINPNNPLRKGMMIKTKSGSSWIFFKYERVLL